MVQVFDWNLTPSSPEMQLLIATKCRFFLKAFIKPRARIISKIHNLHWTELVQTIFHSEFHSDRAYSGFRKGGDQNIVLKWRRKNRLHFKDRTTCCIHPISLIWVPLESPFYALFKNKGCCCDKQILIFTLTSLVTCPYTHTPPTLTDIMDFTDEEGYDCWWFIHCTVMWNHCLILSVSEIWILCWEVGRERRESLPHCRRKGRRKKWVRQGGRGRVRGGRRKKRGKEEEGGERRERLFTSTLSLWLLHSQYLESAKVLPQFDYR